MLLRGGKKGEGEGVGGEGGGGEGEFSGPVSSCKETNLSGPPLESHLTVITSLSQI